MWSFQNVLPATGIGEDRHLVGVGEARGCRSGRVMLSPLYN